MNDQDGKLQNQLALIGARYLARTLGEMQRLHELLHLSLDSSPGMLKDLEHLAHKIHGSGAMFGFEALSERAADVEHLAGFLAKREGPEEFKRLSDDDLKRRLRDCVAKLDEVTRAAAKERGIELNAP
jgi:HPt (histidine-containing phosphotransfer) domain-containing protein